MTKDEVLRLALEALELVSIEFVCNGAHHAKKDRHEWLDPCPIVDRYKQAIIAIKAALEAKDEPVNDELRRLHDLLGKANALARIRAAEIESMKAALEESKQKWINLTLTEIEILFIQNTTPKSTAIDFARAIESRLKEKNCG